MVTTEWLTQALDDVTRERHRQDKKWGDSEFRPTPTLAVLMEEVGEVANALLEGSQVELRKELIQVAAVAVAMVEGYDRGYPPIY